MPPRQPTVFIPHGGGPCFFMEWDPPDTWNGMRAFLSGFIAELDPPPSAVLVVTAHWEAEAFTVSTKARPGLLFDYYGFPPHTYQLSWPARGDAALGREAARLLDAAKLPSATDDARDYDHGVFIPLMLALPEPKIPVVAMSVLAGLDPAAHYAAGRALAPLRDEGVLIVGSGMSYHNIAALMGRSGASGAEAFDAWLSEAVSDTPDQRRERLLRWQDAPGARTSHPREEHLAPIWVAAGAAGDESGRRIYHETVMGAEISAYRFG